MMSGKMSVIFHKSINRLTDGEYPEYYGESIDNRLSSLVNGNSVDNDIRIVDNHLLRRKFVDVHGVRITPATVIFDNTFEGQSYEMPFTILNISSKSIFVRILTARSCSFVLDPVDRCTLAPGLSIKRKIHYQCTKSKIPISILPVYIDGNLFEVHLVANKERAIVDVNPCVINFGRVDLGSRGVQRSFTVTNASYCATKFSVDVAENNLDLVVIPNKGRIRPHHRVRIRIHIIPLVVGEFVIELWVMTADNASTRMQVHIQVCKRSLLTLHPNTLGEFTLIDFKSTFCGSERYETVVVYNKAATVSLFVVLAEIENNNLIPVEEARKTYPNFKMFTIEPREGRINPYEGRIFTVSFAPILTTAPELGWKSKCTEIVDNFLCAIKILRIQADDYLPKQILRGDQGNLERANSMKSELSFNFTPVIHPELGQTTFSKLPKDYLDNDISVRLCLHGEAEVATLTLDPETLYFNEMPVNASDSQVLHLTNISTSLPLAFRYVKISGIELEPSFAFIQPLKTLDVVVKVLVRISADQTKIIKLELITYSNMIEKTNLKTVAIAKVPVVITSFPSPAVVPTPKINLGITPVLTNEVGYHTDVVTFSSNVKTPRNVMFGADKRGKSLPWIKSTAVVAFPNDMPKSLQRRNPGNVKTIFKGMPRYIPPIDNKMTYTAEDAELKKRKEYLWFREIFRGTAAQFNSLGTSVPTDYEISCFKHYEMLNFKPPPQLPDIKKTDLAIPKQILVYLTVLQLYNIKISPDIICFGNVTTNKDCYQNLHVTNNNMFPVSARLIPGRSGIRICTLNHLTIKPMSMLTFKLIFHKETMGHFSGNITCVINEYHSFEIGVIAEVVSKSLTVSPENIEFKMAGSPFHPKFLSVEVHSYLNTPVSFSFMIPSDSPYMMEPLNGIVEKKGAFACAVYFEPDCASYKTSPIKLYVEGVECQILKCVSMFSKPSVYFLDPKLNVGVLPFGLSTLRKAVMFNADFTDVMFVVLNESPANGVTVYPTGGTIKARSCFTLYLNFTVHKVCVLNFLVYVTIQTSVTIEMKVSAQIVSPLVEIRPNSILLLHVPCNSFARTALTVNNKSKSIVEIKFNMDLYPQFKVSSSKKLWDPVITDKGLIMEAESTQKIYLHFIPKDMASYEFYLPLVINTDYDIIKRDSLCSETIALKLMGDVVSKSGEKVTRASIKGKTHRVLVDCVVSKPLLSFSDTVICFDKCDESQTFKIKNQGNNDANIMINTEDLQSNFSIDFSDSEDVTPKANEKVINIVLVSGEEACFKIIFKAPTSGTFNSDLSIHLNDTIYQYIRLTGIKESTYRLSCSEEQVYMVPVPLAVESKAVFCLDAKNHSGKPFSVTYKVEKMYSENISVHFLETPVVPMGNGMFLLPVSVTFSSNSPLSIKAKISFLIEGGGGECFTFINATADNSILTTYAFIYAHLSPHRILKEYDENLNPGDEMNYLEGTSNISNTPKKVCGCGHPQSLKSILALHRESRSEISDETLSSRRRLISVPFVTVSIPNASIAELQRQLLPKEVTLSVQGSKHSNLDSEEVFFPLPRSKDKHRIVAESIADKEDNVNESADTNKPHFEGDDEVESVYPKFPRDSTTEYTKYMVRVRTAVEQWLYEQVFNCSYAPILACETFSGFLQLKKEYRSKTPIVIKHVLNVFEIVFGKEANKFLPSLERLPAEGIDRALYIHMIYTKILEFLNVQGALLSHVEPHLLMTYADYVLLMKHTKTAKDMIIECEGTDFRCKLMSETAFEQTSIQCWLDLMLQTYKVSTLAMCLKLPVVQPVGTIKNDEIKDKSKKKVFKISTVYSRPEDMLLSWLGRHYNAQRFIIWQDKKKFPGQRTIVNFDQDLEDGLVLATVTGAFCPFLNKLFFQDMYLQPETISEAYHNSVRLTTAWNRIHLGFSITPKDFVRPNPIKMIMLVAHLYTILPTYKPEATFEFTATLNTTENQIVSLENPSDYTVSYISEIIGDKHNSFSLTEEGLSFKLNRKQTKQITVCYTGRKATKVRATLLMCGACYPPKFGRNFVFKLEGTPIKLPESAVYNIKSPLNTPTKSTLWITTPHQAGKKLSTEEVYDIWYTEQEPRAGGLDISPWAEERLRKIPRRLFILTDQLKIIGGEKIAQGPIDIQLTCLSPMQRNYWLIFINKDVGDFIVKMKSSAYPPLPMMRLEGKLEDYNRCICQDQPSTPTVCSRYCTLDVPCRNQDIWSAVKLMLELASPPSEKEFWSSHLKKNIGLRLVQWLLGDKKDNLTEEIQHIFKKSKTYVLSSPSEYISFSGPFSIPDVRLTSTTPLSIHIQDGCTLPLETQLVLTSEDQNEIRSYDITIE